MKPEICRFEYCMDSMVLYGWHVWPHMAGVGSMYGMMQVTLCCHTRTWLYGLHGLYGNIPTIQAGTY